MAAPEHQRFWPRCRRWIRRIRVLVWLWLLFAAGGLLFLNQVGVPRFLKDRLETELRNRGVHLQLGRVRLRGFTVFSAENIHVSDSPDTNGFRLVIGNAELRLNAPALRRFQIQLAAISIERARLSCLLTASNAPPAQAALEDLAAEIRFPAPALWDLSDLRGRLLNVGFQISGTVTNPASISDWLKPGAPRKAPVRWQDRLYPLVSQWQKLDLASPASLSVKIQGDGRDPNSFRVLLTNQLAQADTPWGRLDRLRIEAALAPSVQTKEGVEVKARLQLGAARTPWGSLEQGEGVADLRWSWHNPSAFRSEWRWSSAHAHSRWGEIDDLAILGATVLATNQPALLRTEVSLDAAAWRGVWGKSSANHFAATVGVSLTNWSSAEITWRGNASQVQTRWGSAAGARLSGQTAWSTPNRLPPGPGWGPWTKLAPIRMDWEAQLQQFQTPQLDATLLECAGQWQAPNLTLSRLRLDLYGGRIDSTARLDVASRELAAEARVQFDYRELPFLPVPNAQYWLAQVAWDAPPRVTVQGRLRLPAWTNLPPIRAEEILPTLRLSGFVEGTNMAIRGLSITSAQSHFSLTNLFCTAPGLMMTSPRGSLRLNSALNLRNQEFEAEVQSQFDLSALQSLFGSPSPYVFSFFRFTEPPLIRGQARGSLRQLDQIGFVGQVAATNFVFRGERCGEFRATVQLTNQFVRGTDVTVVRDGRRITADSVGYDLRTEFVYVTNGVSSMDPDLVTKVIGPKVRAAIAPYRFGQPPAVRLTGRLPTLSRQPADARFEVQGQAFHYWRFNVPEISGNLHWLGDSLSVSNVQAQFYGGHLDWSGSFDFTPRKGTDFSFQGHVIKSDLHSLIADLTTLTNRLEGVLDGHLTITRANSGDERSWQGFGDAQLRDGLLWDVPIFGFLSPVLNKISPGLGSSRASAATATFTVKDSVVHTSNLESRSPALRLQYSGQVDLEGRVEARVQAEILRDTWVVGRIVSLALWPLAKVFEYKITGTLQQPEGHPVNLPKILRWPLKPFQGLQQMFSGENAKPPASSEPPRGEAGK